MLTIAIGADSAGAPLKEHLAQYLHDTGYEVTDFGNGDDQDYPDVACAVAEAVASGRHDRALLVCGTGPVWQSQPTRSRGYGQSQRMTRTQQSAHANQTTPRS